MSESVPEEATQVVPGGGTATMSAIKESGQPDWAKCDVEQFQSHPRMKGREPP